MKLIILVKAGVLALGIATGIAACGGDDAPKAGPVCSPATSCGGSLVGTWNITTECVQSPTIIGITKTCPGTVTDWSGLTQSGTVTYKGDGAYAANVTTSGKLVYTIPSACISPPKSCAQLEADFMQSKEPHPSSASCVGTDTCHCTLVLSDMSNDTGTYNATGGILVTTYTSNSKSDVQTDTFDYCVTGSKAQLHQAPAPNDTETPDSRYVLTKK